MALCPPAGCTNTPESMLFHYCGTQAHLSGRANSWHLTSAYMKATWLWLWINGSPPSLTSPHFHEASTLALLSTKCLCLVLTMLPSARAPVSKLEDTYRLTDLSVVIIFFWLLPSGVATFDASHPISSISPCPPPLSHDPSACPASLHPTSSVVFPSCLVAPYSQ